MRKKTAIIIGAGPAGLTAAYELLARTDIKPVVLERDAQYVGGISRTVNYKGNRIDIGGHRFFSKSDRVMKWWADMLPVLLPDGASADVTYQRTTRALTLGLARARPQDGDRVMHVRPRKTRILYGGDFYAYPIELSQDTFRKLGIVKLVRIGATYFYAALFPRTERTLEDFFINRFGRELYETFFKSYTEKVWGVPCRELSAEWGAQRVKGLSIRKAITHAARKIFRVGALSGKGVETSLIEQFLYPAYGPGFMWETVAEKIRKQGGEIRMGAEAIRVKHHALRTAEVVIRESGRESALAADYVFSTADVRSLLRMLDPLPPEEVRNVGEGLEYRDFLTVGLLLSSPPAEKNGSPITDTWMYVHEPGVKVGRIQFFHNWDPMLVADPSRGWVGLEYFCTEGDLLWRMSDGALVDLGKEELKQLGLFGGEVLDGVAIRQEKAYPGYFGSYKDFAVIRDYLDRFENLFLVGRNGMHRYNNQDHSMLAAMAAVDAIQGDKDKREIWNVNTEDEYHEQK